MNIKTLMRMSSYFLSTLPKKTIAVCADIFSCLRRLSLLSPRYFSVSA